MGPPPFGDGNRTVAWSAGGRTPSMGPPPFGDGNSPRPPSTACRRSPFNGATAFRRWKLAKASFDGLQEVTLQWGHRLSAMETSPGTRAGAGAACSFNGATAFRRWKPAGQPSRPKRPGSFNGATAFRRWKRMLTVPAGTPAEYLQWGHRLSAMETVSTVGS